MGLWVASDGAFGHGRPWFGLPLPEAGIWAWQQQYSQVNSAISGGGASGKSSVVPSTGRLVTPADYVELRALEIARDDARHHHVCAKAQPKPIHRWWPAPGDPAPDPENTSVNSSKPPVGGNIDILA